MAQQVRRAAALTAELAAQTEKKVSAVCDQPPGLSDEPAVHIEAPNMGAGGSHPQAKMMQEASAVPAAASNFSSTPVASSPFLETQCFRPAGEVVVNRKGKGRGARSWSVLEVQDAVALVEETVGFYVKATGKDEGRMRQKLAETKPGELWRIRENWRICAENEQRLRGKKEDAWKLFRRQPGHKPNTKEKFEQEFKRRVVDVIASPFCNRKEQETYLQLWMNELQKSAEAWETKRMCEEEARSRSHQMSFLPWRG